MTARYGPISRPDSIAIFEHAESGLAAGRVTSQKYTGYLNQLVDPALPGRGTRNVNLSDVFRPGVSNDTESFDLVGEDVPADQLFDVADLPILTDLFGDNPQHWRAFASLAVSGLLSGGDFRADIYLNGGETVMDIIDRAIAWRLRMKISDPSRFIGLDIDEEYEVAIRVVTGWRQH